MYCDNSDALYVGLSATAPDAGGANVSEPAGNNYSRVCIGNITLLSDGCAVNTSDLHFPKSSGIWFSPSSPAQYWVLFDGNESTSNVLTHGQLDKQITVYGNAELRIPAEAIAFTVLDK